MSNTQLRCPGCGTKIERPGENQTTGSCPSCKTELMVGYWNQKHLTQRTDEAEMGLGTLLLVGVGTITALALYFGVLQ